MHPLIQFQESHSQQHFPSQTICARVRSYWLLVQMKLQMSQPYFGPSVGVKPNTPKVGNLESSGTLECLEFDNKAQNTSHWGVLGVIEKVLKSIYRKRPRIGHLDICSPSYG
jgi:hypothetical protein